MFNRLGHSAEPFLQIFLRIRFLSTSAAVLRDFAGAPPLSRDRRSFCRRHVHCFHCSMTFPVPRTSLESRQTSENMGGGSLCDLKFSKFRKLCLHFSESHNSRLNRSVNYRFFLRRTEIALTISSNPTAPCTRNRMRSALPGAGARSGF